jgi:hypothetical protein
VKTNSEKEKANGILVQQGLKCHWIVRRLYRDHHCVQLALQIQALDEQ